MTHFFPPSVDMSLVLLFWCPLKGRGTVILVEVRVLLYGRGSTPDVSGDRK